MARGINKVILVGNVGVDPDVRYMPNGNAVTNITLATTDSWKDKQTGQQQERTFGHGVARAGDDHREWVGEQATGECRTRSHQRHGFFRPGGHHLQVIAARQNPRLTGNDHDGTISLRLIQRRVERRNHVRGNGIDLAVAQGQGRDTVFEVVGNQLTHDAIPYREVGQTLPMAAGQVKRRD